MKKLELSSKLRGFNEIVELWEQKNCTKPAAFELTLEQVEGLNSVVYSDDLWNKLVEIFRRGRVQDAWLASEWPSGFDELVMCAPMCKLVDWECAKCHVGNRQKKYSCANDDSIFGYIAVLLSLENRELLKEHIQKIKHLLTNDNIYWDMEKHDIFIKAPDIS